MTSSPSLPLVLAMTGASGAVYAVRLLQQLCDAGIDVHLVLSPSAHQVLQQELGLDVGSKSTEGSSLLEYCWPDSKGSWAAPSREQLQTRLNRITSHHYQDYMAPIASGSYLTRGMVICPCSGATLSGVVHAAGNNLIQRAAEVHIKERRKLILVPRETPMSVFQLENLHRAAQAGAIVLPAMPGWYHGIQTVVDLIDFIVARILDHLQVPHSLMKRWGTMGESSE